MKLFMHLTILTIFVLLESVSNAGGTRGGGGFTSDESAAYRKGLADFIQKDLGTRVISLISVIDTAKIKDQEIKSVLTRMQKDGALKKDILAMKGKMYEPKDSCLNGKDEYAQAKRQTLICFSLSNLAAKDGGVSLNSIVYLALHAHAHQFGWHVVEQGEMESAHSLAQTLTPDVIRDVSTSFGNVVNDEPVPNPAPEEPVILYSANTTPDKVGMSYEDAQAICERYKLLNSEKYFFTYCTYHEKSWKETYTDTVIYMSSAYYDWYGNLRSATYAPTDMTRTVDKFIYGLEVFGLGNFLTAPYQVILDSRTYAKDPQYAWTFTSASDAFLFCGYFLAGLQTNIKYLGAVCEAKPEDDHFYFIIKTQNPLIK